MVNTVEIFIFVNFREQILSEMNKSELEAIVDSISRLWPYNPPYLVFDIYSEREDKTLHLYMTCKVDKSIHHIPQYLIDGLCNKHIQIRPTLRDSCGERQMNGVEVFFKPL